MSGALGEMTVLAGTVGGVFRLRRRRGEAEVTRLPVEFDGAVWVHRDVDDPSTLFAGSRAGLSRSTDGGETWAAADKGLTVRHVFAMAQHPRTGVLYVGTEPSAVFTSDDRGDTWTQCGDLGAVPTSRYWSFPLPPHDSHVRGFGLAAADPDLVMCAIEEGWLVRSTDGGATWENVRQGTDYDSHAVLFLPDDPAEVVATSGYGLYRSVDSGRSFTRVTNGLDRRYFTAPYAHPERPDRVFTAAAAVVPPLWRRPEGPDSAFYRSEDRGVSWERLEGGLPAPLNEAPTAIAGNRDDAAMVVVGTATGTVWGTVDGGASFSQFAAGTPMIRSLAVV